MTINTNALNALKSSINLGFSMSDEDYAEIRTEAAVALYRDVKAGRASNAAVIEALKLYLNVFQRKSIAFELSMSIFDVLIEAEKSAAA